MPPFECPPERREGLEAVKRAVGIHHHYLDGWVYLFYENKKFDFKETVAKLQRRDHMEKTVFANYEITPSLKQSMRAGIVQYIGRDKAGRPVLYFNTARDSPTSDQRPERQANMDMFLSWAVRCDPINPTATVTWLINQQDASLMRNTDIIFQKDMALRISKFFPGVVAKMYICNMGSALTFVMKPLLKQLPKSISECIFLYSGGDIRGGKLLEVIDADVLPIAMGGNNNIDHKQNYEFFATTIESYFHRCQRALREGISIKEMEMMEAYGVDKDGHPRPETKQNREHGAQPVAAGPEKAHGPAAPNAASSSITRVKRIEEAGEETLDLAGRVIRAPSRIRVDRDDKEAIVVMSSSLRQRGQSKSAAAQQPRAGRGPTGPLGDDASGSDDAGEQTDSSYVDVFSPNALPMPGLFPMENKDGKSHQQQKLTFFHSSSQSNLVDKSGACEASSDAAQVDRNGLPVLCVDTIEVFSFAKNIPDMNLSYDKVCDLQRCWTLFLCHCVTLLPQLCLLMESLRDNDMPLDEVQQLHENIPLLRRVMHHVLSLFPQTTQPLHYPIFHWLTAKQDDRRQRCALAGACVAIEDRIAMDCTSPDNFLLSVQGTSVEYVDECEKLLEEDKIKDRILRRVALSWPAGVAYGTLVSGLQTKVNDLWRQVVPLFRKYIEAKVAMSIGEFIDHYGLLASGGKMDTRAPWYSALFSGLVQYRELHRKNWLFHVFPPPFSRSRRPGAVATAPGANAGGDAPPTMLDMVAAQSDALPPTLGTVSEFVLLVERSLQGTREQLGATSVTKIASHVVVERYMEETGTKMYIPYEAQLTGFRPKELIAAEKDAARQLLEAVEQPLREFLFLTAILFVLGSGDVDGGGGPPSGAGAAAAPPSRDMVLQQVDAARRVCREATDSRRESRRVAFAIAKVAYEVQGTFGTDAGGPGGNPVLPVYGEGEHATTPVTGAPAGASACHAPVRPDGFAIALDLLVVEALVSQHVAQQASPPTNESFALGLGSGGRRSSFDSSPANIDLLARNGPAAAASPPDNTATGTLDAGSDGAGSDDDADMKSACSAEGVDVAAFLDTISAMDAAAIPLVTAKRQLVR